jgi:hypothetical protein
MIEIFRKGQRLEIPSSQVVTMKRAVNLNGIQQNYAYSNTVSLTKTANIIKLLELPELPVGKVATLQNGYDVDIVMNGSIQLRNQKLKITKETVDKVDLYILFSESSLLLKLKTTYLSELTQDYRYHKTIANLLLQPSPAIVQTQRLAGQYVIEEMPLLINIQELIKKIFTDNNYSVFGDFTRMDNTIKDYFIAGNQGVYEIYTGSGDGFSPSFETNLTAYDLLQQTLSFFNCYATIDDTYRTVVINQWSNLVNFKNDFKDYSKYYISYQDYTFQSKLAKRNELTYADSDTLFNSYFTNNLSAEEKTVYLDSKFGSGGANLFDDSEVSGLGTIELRAADEIGESSAIRIYKKSETTGTYQVYEKGIKYDVIIKKAVSVSMRTVYDDFHRDYTDFILQPLIQNVKFRYDDILASDFSLTKVFFLEQLSSYWIPLEINLSTKKDFIMIKSMMVRRKKFAVPVLNNFNSVLLNFKQKVIFPKTFLLSMYPMPPNEYNWETVIFNSYDQDKNRLYIDDVLIPANTLPRSFDVPTLVNSSIVIEANKDSDIFSDTNTDSLYLTAIDTVGGISNEAYINLKHTGIAELESNFIQGGIFSRGLTSFGQPNSGGSDRMFVNTVEYYIGTKPNLNNTVNTAGVESLSSLNDSYNLIESIDTYTNVNVNIKDFTIRIKGNKRDAQNITGIAKVIINYGFGQIEVAQYSIRNNEDVTFNFTEQNRNIPSLPIGGKIKVFVYCEFNFVNDYGFLNSSATFTIENMAVDISTTKTI